jgi:hypothetical protein
MDCDISWNHIGGEIKALPARVDRIKQHDQKLYIHFEGQEPEYGEIFSGVLILQLTEQYQNIASFYTSAKQASPSSEKKIAFTLYGRFQNSTFSEFSGSWEEEGGSYQFEICGIPSEKIA